MPTFPKQSIALLVLCAFLSSTQAAQAPTQTSRWSNERANAWYAAQPWPVGFNYVPRYAINQIEMWQEDSFDPATIDQELAWAADIGFNMVRVFLHDLLWREDAAGLVARIDEFLAIADRHGIRVMFVLFDDVWDPHPRAGRQREPRPGVHNSGWVQGPGVAILGDPRAHDQLEPYVRGILARYGQDRRVAVWDLYNEPGNDNFLSYGRQELDGKHVYSLQLLARVFAWARAEAPSQPLTAAVWRLWDGEW